MTCPRHDGLCAYRGNEPHRCPWCHCLWAVIDSSGWHSCEKANLWDSHIRELTLAAVTKTRLERHENRGRGTHTYPVEYSYQSL